MLLMKLQITLIYGENSEYCKENNRYPQYYVEIFNTFLKEWIEGGNEMEITSILLKLVQRACAGCSPWGQISVDKS